MTVKHLPYEIDETESAHFHEHYWKECALRLLMSQPGLDKGAALLDYGCGRGEFLHMAEEAGLHASGLDMDEKCIELAKRFGSAELIDPEDYLGSMPDKSVDVVSSFHVLEHVENPKRLLNNMRRIARQYVLIAVPNLRCFHNIRKTGIQQINEGHLQGWDRDTLCNLAVRHCGLELVAFASDMTKFPSISYRTKQIFGAGVEKEINLKVFSKIWPSKSLSLIALFKPKD